MIAWIRRIGLLLSAAGGAWGAFRLLDVLARRVEGGGEFHLTSEALLFVIPVCVVGALVGSVVGGMVLPRDSS